MLESGVLRPLRRAFAAGLACALASGAHAQTFDGHGSTAPPDSAAPLDPVWIFVADTSRPATAGLTLEYIDDPLIQTFDNGDSVPIIDDLGGASIDASVAIGDRVVVGAVLPTWLIHNGSETSNGPVPGDYVLGASARLLGDQKQTPFALDLTPQLSVPTGADALSLGASGVTAGVSVLGVARVPRAAFYGSFGAGVEPNVDAVGWSGGPRLTGGVAAAVLLTEDLAAQLDARGYMLLAGEPGERPVPSEILVTLKRGSPASALWGSASAGTATTAGVGAPSFRALAHIGFSWGTTDDSERARPGEVLSVVDVRTEDGRAIRGAEVRIKGEVVATTDHEGRATLPENFDGRKPVQINHPSFDERMVAIDGKPVVMTRPSIPMTVSVVDSNGARVDASVTVIGTETLDAATDADGNLSYEMTPGDWVLEVNAPGLTSQTHRIPIAPEREDSLSLDIILRPTDADARTIEILALDAAGNPVEGAMLFVDGQPIATTGPDGSVTVTGLAEDASSLEITHPTLETAKVEIGTGDSATAVLAWPTGFVTVLATGPDGGPTDGLLVLKGATSTLPARSLGADGKRDLRLAPGEWTALISSITLGAQERRFAVPDRPGVRQLIEIALLGDEGGDADVEVQVIDLDGQPIDGAQVLLDGDTLGATSSAGSVTLLGVYSGERRLRVTAPGMVPADRTLRVQPGPQRREIVMGYRPGAVLMTATDPGGRPLDARVALLGPSRVPSVELGTDGSHLFQLEPGEWTVLVSSPTAGSQERTFEVPEGWDRLIRADVQLAPPEGGDGKLTVVVTDPDGMPVADAAILLDDHYIGTTTNTGSVTVSDLRMGTREFSVSSPAFLPMRHSLIVGADTQSEVALAWGPGAVRIRIEGGGSAVPDAMIAMHGPIRVPATRPGGDGSRLLALTPGEWIVLVSSPIFLPEEKALSIPDAPVLTEVTFALTRPIPDSGVLLLRVFDDDRNPVQGAKVSVGGQRLGQTSASGSVFAQEVQIGNQEATIQPPEGWLQTQISLDIRSGSQQARAVVAFAPIVVKVRAIGSGGSPVPADVTFQGPEFVRTGPAGPFGEISQPLRPGKWTLSAHYEDLEGVVQFELHPGDEVLTVEIPLEAHKARVTGETVDIDERIPFEINKATLTPDSTRVLDDIAAVLLANPSILLLEVQGHTDDQGGAAFNLDLSQRRAQAVVDALEAAGVPEERLVAVGYGLLRPLDREDRARNRRVEFSILE